MFASLSRKLSNGSLSLTPTPCVRSKLVRFTPRTHTSLFAPLSDGSLAQPLSRSYRAQSAFTLYNLHTPISRRSFSTNTTLPQQYKTPEEVVTSAAARWDKLEFGAAISELQAYIGRPKESGLPQHIPIIEDREAYVALGTLLMSQGRYKEASEVYGKLAKATQTQLDRWENVLTSTKEDIKRRPKVEEDGELDDRHERIKALEAARQDMREIAGIYFSDLGRALEFCGDALASQEAYTKALELLQVMENPDPRLIGVIQGNLSMLYENLGNYKVANEHHLAAMRVNPMMERFDHPHIASVTHHIHLLTQANDEREKIEQALDKMDPNWREQSESLKTTEELVEEAFPPSRDEIAYKAAIARAAQAHQQSKEAEVSRLAQQELENSSYGTQNLDQSPQTNTTATTATSTSATTNTPTENTTTTDVSSPTSKVPVQQRLSPVDGDLIQMEDGSKTTTAQLLANALSQLTSDQAFDLVQKDTEDEATSVRQTLQQHRYFFASATPTAAAMGENSKKMALVPLLLHLGILERKLGKFDSSLALVDEALDLIECVKGKKHCSYATALMHKSLHYFTMQEWAQAEVCAREALTIKQELLPPDHLHVGLVYYDLASILGRRSLHKESIQYLKLAEEIFAATLFEDHPLTKGVRDTSRHVDALLRRQSTVDSQLRLKGFISQ